MRPLKCSVGGCNSTNETHRMFSFPKNDKLRSLWMSFIVPTNPLLIGLPIGKLQKKRVCERHFDKYQFDCMGQRLRYSYPCLFTKDEIAHGVPLAEGENSIDHSYYKIQDADDISTQTVMVIKDADIEINSELPAENKHISSQSTSQVKGWTPTVKRKWDETENCLTFNDTNINDNVELEPEDNYFAMDHDIILDDFDDATETKDDSQKADEDVKPMSEVQLENDTLLHTNFKCNVCLGDIVGFRYSCLQCLDWDMCAACEARGEHPAHYVLRIPAPTTYAECEPVIAAIRDQIQNLLQLSKEIKSEIYFKEEADIDAMPEDFNSNLTDPILIANDRSVPELSMREECSTVHDGDISNDRSLQTTEIECDTRTLDNSESLSALRKFLLKKTKNSSKQIRICFKANQGNFSRQKVNESLKEIIESISNSSDIVQTQNYDYR